MKPRMLIVMRTRPMELFKSEEDPRLLRLKRRDPDYLKVLEAEEARLERTIESVSGAALQRGWDIETVGLGDPIQPEGFELVVPVGGDGTVLEASHFLQDQPVLGVNSSPKLSVGFFCAANAENFANALDARMAGKAIQRKVTRMQISLGEELLPFSVLNDVLYSHSNPAAMSAYRIRLEDWGELQFSSGVWISTGAGSTAAIRSAGGRPMPIDFPDLQYMVREPYYKKGERYRLLGGRVDGESGFTITCRNESAAIYLDGHYRRVEMNFGDDVTFRRSQWPLNLIIQPPEEAGGWS